MCVNNYACLGVSNYVFLWFYMELFSRIYERIIYHVYHGCVWVLLRQFLNLFLFLFILLRKLNGNRSQAGAVNLILTHTS